MPESALAADADSPRPVAVHSYAEELVAEKDAVLDATKVLLLLQLVLVLMPSVVRVAPVDARDVQVLE